MVIRAATGSAALQFPLMSDCCVRGETDTAQPHCDCLTLCLVFVVNMFVLLALDYMFLCDVSLFRFCVWLLKDEPAAVWPPCWWFPPSMFPLLCSSECEAEVFCVPAELLLHPASLLSLI